MLLNLVVELTLGQIAETSSYNMPPLIIFWNIFGILAGLIIITIATFFFLNKPKKIKQKANKLATKIKNTSADQLQALNKDLKPYGFAYDMYEDIFYSMMECWQRDFGYCRLYDETCAPLSMIIDCEPIRFEYNGIKWLIEFWKGQYGLTSGGEVGIYYTKALDLNIPGIFDGTFYYSVSNEDRINMAFAFRKNDDLLFTRNGYHWWLTGFKLGEFADPAELSMDIVLELYDTNMCDAFVNALKKAGYSSKEYSVSGRIVNINFDKPHTAQPYSRTSFTEYIMKKNNQSLCSAYQNMTEESTDTLDKLEIIKNKAPKMYNDILNVGKSPKIFDSFHNITEFISKSDEKGKG